MIEGIVAWLAVVTMTIVLYCYMDWSNEKLRQLRKEQERLRGSLEQLYIYVCKGDKQ